MLNIKKEPHPPAPSPESKDRVQERGSRNHTFVSPLLKQLFRSGEGLGVRLRLHARLLKIIVIKQCKMQAEAGAI
jgi:hypothetical protein